MIIPQLELGPRLCVHSHFSSQGTRKLTPLVSQAHVSKKTVVIVRFFLRRDLGTPVGSISLLSMHVLVMFVENNQIFPWHSFWFGWSVGNCILYRFQDVYRSWLPVELKHEIVFPAALNQASLLSRAKGKTWWHFDLWDWPPLPQANTTQTQ